MNKTVNKTTHYPGIFFKPKRKLFKSYYNTLKKYRLLKILSTLHKSTKFLYFVSHQIQPTIFYFLILPFGRTESCVTKCLFVEESFTTLMFLRFRLYYLRNSHDTDLWIVGVSFRTVPFFIYIYMFNTFVPQLSSYFWYIPVWQIFPPIGTFELWTEKTAPTPFCESKYLTTMPTFYHCRDISP